MKKLNRKERRALQSAREQERRRREEPVEFACCGACDYLIKVYCGEDGQTKPCPRCGWGRHRLGGSWNRRGLVGAW